MVTYKQKVNAMLHLLPLRPLFTCAIALTAFFMLLIFAVEDPLAKISRITAYAGLATLAFIVLSSAMWRWFALLQSMTFPYLGGKWTGQVKFGSASNQQTRDVDLTVSHTLFSLRLILNSKESTSETLVVHAERNRNLDRIRLYYVYLNQRKEGFSNSGRSYRGVAILRVEEARPLRMLGDYFTELQRSGTIELQHIEGRPWWMLWK